MLRKKTDSYIECIRERIPSDRVLLFYILREKKKEKRFENRRYDNICYLCNGGKEKMEPDRDGDLGVAGFENSDSGMGDS